MLDGYRGNWLVRLMANGFESVMAVYGTEEEMRQYMRHIDARLSQLADAQAAIVSASRIDDTGSDADDSASDDGIDDGVLDLVIKD